MSEEEKVITSEDSSDDEDDEDFVDDDSEVSDDSLDEETLEDVDELGSEVEMHSPGRFDPDQEDNIFGGLVFDTTEEIKVPDELIDQVIGQDNARRAVRKAAQQGRHLMMIGSPGTGKSMLAKSMSEMMPDEDFNDVLIKPNLKDENEPTVETVPAGKGKLIVEAAREQAKKQRNLRRLLAIIVGVVIAAYAIFVSRILLGVIALLVLYIAYRYISGNIEANTPNMLIDGSEKDKAPFEDSTGAHAGALLGDVRHDPFQSGHMAVPAHKRVEAGAIHKAHKGVLFIDEINTLDLESQQKLMTAIQEGEFSITGQSERSSGAMVQTDPVPCDFVLVAAGNMDAMQNMHPAIRDRIRGYGYEVYMDDNIEDTPEMRRKYARFVAQEVKNDENIPHFTDDAVAKVIDSARLRADRKGHLTLHLRSLGGLVRAAGDIAKREGHEYVQQEDVIEAKDRSKTIEEQVADEMIERKEEYNVSMTQDEVIGRVNGLAVYGETSGILLPIMSEVAPSLGGESVIATGKLQEIAAEAVDNVSAIIKRLGGEDKLNEKDIHIQFVQTHEGVDGDSASVTVATAVMSAIERVPIKQNVAMTGSLSVRGDVLPVGGVSYKIEAAAKSGMEKVIVPAANSQDINVDDGILDQIEVVPVTHISEVLEHALADTEEARELIRNVKEITGEPATRGDVVNDDSAVADHS